MSGESSENIGYIVSIDGPVIKIKGLKTQKIGDLVKIGHQKMVGEIIKINGDIAIAQCYENTEGLCLHEPVLNTDMPLSMELGPGMLGTIFDGIQRPLDKMGDFIKAGVDIPSLPRDKKWHFKPLAKPGDKVKFGDIIGEVPETEIITHKIMVPYGVTGTIEEIAPEGDYLLEDIIYSVKHNGNIRKFSMLQKWPIRRTRPFRQHLYPDTPLITGMRVIDLLFPIARGGAAAMPGGFGTGKTVTQHSFAKFCHADIIVYIGCGERGNEMADVLTQFPELHDPRYDKPLMERTILIGNTSNMPVSAREASIFSGLTMAEYFRDMGYHVTLLADSTSRWAEALRELSSRLEEMPAEGGYPAYLSTKLANFYERAGCVIPFGSPERLGSVTLVGAVSPPSGDFSEPVTKTTRRFVRAFWALDAKLAYARHYPSINWTISYSLYEEYIDKWWDKIEEGWASSRQLTSEILAKSDQLQNIVQLVGKENLPVEHRLVLYVADMIKRMFLIQNAYDEIDRYSSPEKTLKLIKLILLFYKEAKRLIAKNIPLFRMQELPIVEDIARVKNEIPNDQIEKLDELKEALLKQFKELEQEYME